MKVSNLKKDKGSITFTLEGATPAFANIIRRSMICWVPTLAIEDINLFENSSALYDEIIAHRIGMIPIKTDLKTFKLLDECSCKGKGCVRCQVTFTLVKKGPCTVSSGDLKSSDSKATVADPNIPIVNLIEGQKMKLEAIAVLGQGKEHAKWQPGVISYKYEPNPKKKEQDFTFYVETSGSMQPQNIVVGGADVIAKKAKELAKAVK